MYFYFRRTKAFYELHKTKLIPVRSAEVRDIVLATFINLNPNNNYAYRYLQGLGISTPLKFRGGYSKFMNVTQETVTPYYSLNKEL